MPQPKDESSYGYRLPIMQIVMASRHRALMPMVTDDGVRLRGLDPYWKVRPVGGFVACRVVPTGWGDEVDYIPIETVGLNPLAGALGRPANDNKGWITMKRLAAECLIMWLAATMLVCWAIGWYFAFAPQLGGFRVMGHTVYLPFQYAFWELRPQDAWVQKLGHLLSFGFTGLAAYRFQKDYSRIDRPFNEGEMGDVSSASKRGLVD